MKIGGFNKLSTIDYPGEICSVIFTQGCNFQCPYCHNYRLVHHHNDELIDLCYISNVLKKKIHLIEAVTISGGEPTMQVGLPDLCRGLKDFGLKVKIDTNGTNPEMLLHLIKSGLVDFVAMDIKAPIYEYCFSPTDFSDKIKDSIKILLAGLVDYEFRTTCVSPFVSIENASRIGQDIHGAKKLFLQQATESNVLDPSFFIRNGRCLSFGEILEIQKAISPYVASCEVR